MNAINEESTLYYKYKDLELYNSESLVNREYEKKLQMFPDIIYPEYKKGKTVHELANCYQLETYLIEEYILKMENKQSDNKLSTVEISDDKIIALENKLMTLEQKLDYIISVISK